MALPLLIGLPSRMTQAEQAGWRPCLYKKDRASLSMDFISSLPKVGEDGTANVSGN